MVVLLIDISAKQEYIFSSTKLKDNIGASHIIAEKVFSDELLSGFNLEYEVVYKGGGELCLSFTNLDDCNLFIKIYSLKILKDYPGVKLNFGIKENFDSENNWQDQKKTLIRSIATNRSLYHVNFRPFKLGIAADCVFTGNHQEVLLDEKAKYVSKEVIVKRKAEKENAQFLLKENNVILDNFSLTSEFEKLNIDDTHGYVAVVHIDGNGLGRRFKKRKTLTDYKQLSDMVNQRIKVALDTILTDTCKLFSSDGPFDQSKENPSIRLDINKGKHILPIRPIINAGDDITFICHGKIGLHLAIEYMRVLRMSAINNEIIHSSAGVAIVNKKFPFAKAYQLADELASEGKKKGRKLGDNEGKWNWINFFISPEGFTGDFDELKERHFGNLKRGPYLVGNDQELENVTSFEELQRQLFHLAHSEEKWSRNKLIELRENLAKDSDEQELFRLHMEMRGKELEYDMNDFPYKDLVNMIDFYPLELLESCVTRSV